MSMSNREITYGEAVREAIAEEMRRKIATGGFLAVVVLIIWALVDLHLSTKRELSGTRQLLISGASLEELERAIGKATHEYSADQIPEYLKSVSGFREREGTMVRVYNKEGLPYWWVLVQIEGDNEKIVWHAVAER